MCAEDLRDIEDVASAGGGAAEGVAVPEHLRARGLRVAIEVTLPGPIPPPGALGIAFTFVRSVSPCACITIERLATGGLVVRGTL